MELQAKAFQIRGMAQDLSTPNIPADTAFENMNLRIISNETNVSGSLTNEKGTLYKPLSISEVENDIKGIPLGYATFEEDLVIFSTDEVSIHDIVHDELPYDIPYRKDTLIQIDFLTSKDYIYHIEKEGDDLKGKILYEGHLNFNKYRPIHTQVSVENDELKKVYWTDGLNIPRMINIEEDTYGGPSWQYDFIPDLSLQEKVSIEKLTYGGQYYSGTVQYFFTYFNKYKQESNIFYQSPLYYCTDPTKGAAPDEQTTNAFKIEISNLQTDFDYVRIYAVFRPTVDAPEVRKIQDIGIQKSPYSKPSINFIDTGENYEPLELNDLLYVGGQRFTAETLAINNTKLFLGNLRTPTNVFTETLKRDLRDNCTIECVYTKDGTVKTPIKRFDFDVKSDQFILNYSSYDVTTFKVGQTYRFGVQFQDYKGIWSEVVFLKDFKIKDPIIPHPGVPNLKTLYWAPVPVITFNSIGQFLLKKLKFQGYIKARPVVVFPEEYEKEVICQGLVQSALTRMSDIKAGQYNAFPSWYIRSYGGYLPFSRGGYLNYLHEDMVEDEYPHDLITKPHLVHKDPIFLKGNCQKLSFEIQNYCNSEYPKIFNVTTSDSILSKREEHILLSDRTVTIHSPEVHRELFNLDNFECNLHFIGKTHISSLYNNLLLEGNTTHMIHSPTEEETTEDDSDTEDWIYASASATFNKKMYSPKGNTFLSTYKSTTNEKIISIAAWEDAVVTKGDDLKNDKKMYDPPTSVALWAVFPFHNNSYLTNISYWEGEMLYNKGLDYKSGVLQKKIFSYNQFCESYSMYRETSKYQGSAASVYPDTGTVLLTGKQRTYTDPFSYENPITYTECDNNKYIFSNSPIIVYNNNVPFLLNYHVVTFETFGLNLRLGFNPNVPTNPNKIINFLPINSIDEFNLNNANDPVLKRYRFAPAYIYKGNKVPDKQIKPLNNDTTARSGLWASAFAEQSVSTRISFKSGPYIVFVTNTGDGNNPVIWRNYTDDAWNIFGEEPGSNIGELTNGDMELCELRRENISNMFGGNTEEALSRNTWLPCGEAVNILDPLYCLEGDTYFQKYECLKTYPDEDNPQNGIVDIVSFPCETYYNIEGRYDNNKYLTNPVFVEDSIFNKINPAYTQKNNFFVGVYIPTNRIYLDTFPNQITWSTNKVNGELVDSWTNVPLLNVLDLRLDSGSLTKLVSINNMLMGFHDSAIVQVRYNSNQQITTTQGTPIELVATDNVEGYNTLLEGIGASDQMQICKTPAGVAFFDSSSKDLYIYAQQLQNLSKSLGMHSWFQQFEQGSWDPVTYSIPTLQYDSVNRELMVTTKDTCVAYSFDTGTFTSLYSYEDTPFMINFKDSHYMLHENQSIYKMWEKHGTDRCTFFSQDKPYYTIIAVNDNPLSHKILNTIEYRADFYDVINASSELSMTFNFNKLKVWNEYQFGDVELNYARNNISTLQGKFRTWRVQAPRNNTNKDRIAGNWAYVYLGRELLPPSPAYRDPISAHKMILHDITVSYFS